jgi:hypothetical protein
MSSSHLILTITSGHFPRGPTYLPYFVSLVIHCSSIILLFDTIQDATVRYRPILGVGYTYQNKKFPYQHMSGTFNLQVTAERVHL